VVARLEPHSAGRPRAGLAVTEKQNRFFLLRFLFLLLRLIHQGVSAAKKAQKQKNRNFQNFSYTGTCVHPHRPPRRLTRRLSLSFLPHTKVERVSVFL
jgi:hypothetical protein